MHGNHPEGQGVSLRNLESTTMAQRFKQNLKSPSIHGEDVDEDLETIFSTEDFITSDQVR
jgi:hypothetical protein